MERTQINIVNGIKMIDFLKNVLLTLILIYAFIFVITTIEAIKENCFHTIGVKVFLIFTLLVVGFLSVGYIFA
jgi:hypothetical protein